MREQPHILTQPVMVPANRALISRVEVERALSLLPLSMCEFSPRMLQWGEGEAVALSQLGNADLPAWLERSVLDITGPDTKLAGAFLAGTIGWCLSDLVAGLAVRGTFLAEAPADAVALCPRRVDWEYEGETGTRYIFDIALNLDRVRFAPVTVRLRGALENLFASTVDAIHATTSLPRPALWRLMGDSVSAALLEHGKLASCAQDGMDLALDLLREKGSPLFSKQTRFCQVTLPERPEISDWFLIRGGCCRYYTAPDGEYCTSCVLRDDESRTQRLQTHLRSMNAV